MTAAVHRVRRFDPARRDRIIDACLRVIATSGVAGASHRTIAAEADVPLGSMTYHFTGMDELLHAAFERFATSVSDRFEERMARATSLDEARDAVVATVLDAVEPREMVLSLELYTLAAREPSFRDLTHSWMARSRRGLDVHFDPETARLLDALIEGLQIHHTLDTQDRDPSDARLAVARITGKATHVTLAPVQG